MDRQAVARLIADGELDLSQAVHTRWPEIPWKEPRAKRCRRGHEVSGENVVRIQGAALCRQCNRPEQGRDEMQIETSHLEAELVEVLGKLGMVGATVSSLTKRIKHDDGREVRVALDRLVDQGVVQFQGGMGNNRRYRVRGA